MPFQLKSIILLLIIIIIFTYLKIDTQIRSQYKIQNKLKEHIKDRINERIEKHIKNIKNKNKIKLHTSNKIERENFNKLMKYVSDNQTELTADSNSIQDIYNITELENFKNSSDYEEMWNIAIDKWTRNWNFYREHLTNSILEKFQLNNKRQKRQTKEDYIELTGQNINGSAIARYFYSTLRLRRRRNHERKVLRTKQN